MAGAHMRRIFRCSGEGAFEYLAQTSGGWAVKDENP